MEGQQAAERDAYRQAEAGRWADRIPVTDAELEQRGRRTPSEPKLGRAGARRSARERAADEANLAEVRAELERFGELIDRIPDPAAERRAETDEAGHQRAGWSTSRGPSRQLEASWQPGEVGAGRRRPPEFEMELG